jgi:hypothetical protein
VVAQSFPSSSKPRTKARVVSSHLTRVLKAFWPTLAWVAGLIAYREVLHDRLWAVSAGLWGLLILFSFIAWGATVTRALSRRLGSGFDGATGAALTITVLGALSSLRLMSAPIVVLWCAGGPLALSIAQWRATGRAASTPRVTSTWPARLAAALQKPRPFAYIAGLAVLYAMAALQYVESVTNPGFNQWDDDEVYRIFAREFLDTGTLYEPFSLRRAAAYGGQSLLHALVLALSDRERLHLVDNGICVVLLLLMITGFRTRPRWSSRAAVLTAGFLLFILPYWPHNTASEFSGALFFMALYRLFDDPLFDRAPLRSNAVLVALLVSATCTLRQNYVSAALAFVGFVYLGRLAFPTRKNRMAWLLEGVAATSLALACLVPWLWMAYRAEHTVFYPLIKGNLRPDFGFIGEVTRAELARWTLWNIFKTKPIIALPLIFAGALALPTTRRTRAVHAFLFVTVLSFAMMMYFFRSINDSDSIGRYYFAFMCPFAISVALRSVGDVAQKPIGGTVAAAALVIAAVAIQFMSSRDELLALYGERINALEDMLKNRRSHVEDRGGVARSIAEGEQARLEDVYRRLQASIPAGEPILVVLDHTYMLDGKRNPIYVYDHPFATGPNGGPPCFEGPETLARYFQSVGIRYVAYQWGDSSPEYSTGHWKRLINEVPPAHGRGGFYKNQARFELDFLDSITSLSANRAKRFEEGEMKVLDLATPSRS